MANACRYRWIWKRTPICCTGLLIGVFLCFCIWEGSADEQITENKTCKISGASWKVNLLAAFLSDDQRHVCSIMRNPRQGKGRPTSGPGKVSDPNPSQDKGRSGSVNLLTKPLDDDHRDSSAQTTTSANNDQLNNDQRQRRPAPTTTSANDDQRQRRPAPTTTSANDDQRQRRPAPTTTSANDDQHQRWRPTTSANDDQLERRPADNDDQREESLKMILLANSFYGEPDWELGGSGDVPFKNLGCNRRCFFTTDNRNFNVSDALLFHIHQLGSKVPRRFNLHQRWVFFMLEPPGYSKNLNFRGWNGQFNWTMTYRLDSDIPMVSGKVVEKKRSDRNTNTDRILTAINANKTKLVAWSVSNCYTQSERRSYVAQLQEHINVDIYGECGTLECPKDWLNKDAGCMSMIANTYKFYLAFENSFCKDYVTEKFFKTLPYDLVPIVRGGVNYKDFLPPMASTGHPWYIDTKDFRSTKALADYLHFLDQNPNEYAKYLQGREDYEFETYLGLRENPAFCDLCDKLNDESEPVKVHNDIVSWWGPKDCWIPRG